MNRLSLMVLLGVSLAPAGALVWAADVAPDVKTQSEQPGPDSLITTKIKADLAATKEMPADKVSVFTINGVVTLAGELENPGQVQRTVEIAKAVNGVRSVDASALLSRQ